jgi:hypothetical protein
MKNVRRRLLARDDRSRRAVIWTLFAIRYVIQIDGLIAQWLATVSLLAQRSFPN